MNPSRIAIFDLSSSWVTGRSCELAARGYSRDGKKGCQQIEYGLLTDPAGRPVAIRVFAGNTADPTAFTAASPPSNLRANDMVCRGPRHDHLRPHHRSQRPRRARLADRAARPFHRRPAADNGPLQMSLFDDQDFAELTHPDYPGERLICCRNPLLAAERARKRSELLAATEQLLAPILAAVAAGRLIGADKIGLKVGKVINSFKMAKHLHLTITDDTVALTRTTTPSTRGRPRRHLRAAHHVQATTSTPRQWSTPTRRCRRSNATSAHQSRRHRPAPDPSPPGDRVRAHVLICMLASYLVWHLRQARPADLHR